MRLQALTIKKLILPVVFGILTFGLPFEDAKASEQQDTETSNKLEESITLEQLEALGAFPEEYDTMSHLGRLDWLNSRLNEAETLPEIYNYKRAKAFEFFSEYINKETTKLCQNNEPLNFDLGYRYLCILVSDTSYEDRISDFLNLYQDAMSVDNKSIAAQVLVSMGWYQSGNGDIDLAFKSYNEALSFGESLNFYELNDAMANTATLYIVHGDKEYVQKGISLHKETIKKLEQQVKDEPSSAQYVNGSITIARFNIGVAYALHLHDYAKALKWFRLVNSSNPDVPHLKMSSLIFTALSAVEIGQPEEAQNALALSYNEPEIQLSEFSYIYCYRELVSLKLGKEASVANCLPLHPNVPLEVKIDFYKRASELDNDALRGLGQEQFYKLYVDKLESQLKQSSSPAAATAEQHRQQQETRLRNELLEKEVALKTAAQERAQDQIRLVIALALILILLTIIMVIRLRQKRRLARQYEKLSIRDALTGIKNRRFFEQNIERELSYIKRSHTDADSNELGIFLIDIDHFKAVNDKYGHEAGDKVLIEFARRIRKAIRDADLFVRWGGEEFILAARLDPKEDGLNVLANRLLESVKKKPYKIDKETQIEVTCTIGAVLYPCVANNTKDITWNKLVKLSDMALYYGKHKQRDCWVCIESIIEPESWDYLLAQDFEYLVKEEKISISSSIAPSLD